MDPSTGTILDDICLEEQARLNEIEPRHLLEAFGDNSGFIFLSCANSNEPLSRRPTKPKISDGPCYLEVNRVSGLRSNPQDSSNNKRLHAILQILQCDHQTPAFLDSLMMCHADVLPVFLHGNGLNCFSCFHVLIETCKGHRQVGQQGSQW